MKPRDLSDHVPYRAGRGVEEVARRLGKNPDDLIKLSSNENVLGPSPRALEVLRKRAEVASVYPKSSHTDLAEELADRWDVDPEQIWLGNGADGAIDCLSRAVLRPGETTLVPEPGFSYYGMSTRYHHGRARSYPVDREKDFRQAADTILPSYEDERMIFINTPHNPTGSEMKEAEIEDVARETGDDTLILVDEAYAEFSDRDSTIKLVRERDDVAILRTFSKAYGLAGLRIGYAIVPREWAGAYAKIHTPFDSGELACRAALAALDDDEHLKRTIAMVRSARTAIYDRLNARTWKSGGNFVLAEVGDAEAVTDHAQRQGVILRDCTSFGLPDCVRITCGTADMMDRVIDVLNNL